LLVEDNEVSRQVAVELLMAHDIKVEVAADGSQALHLLSRQDFDGVLMDIQMPVMDGYSATAKIREQEKFKTLPIIAMTADDMPSVIERALLAGMNDHVSKPFNPDHMFAILAKWIKPANPAGTGTSRPISADEEIDFIPELPGINQAQSVLAESPGLYFISLKMVLDKYANFAAVYQQAIDEDDRKEATRHAHSLKGVAATIGARQLFAAAKHLQQISQNNEPTGQALQDTITELAILLNGIKRFVSEVEQANKLPQLPGIQTRQALSRVGGRVAAYRRILKGFLNSNSEMIQQITHKLAVGDLSATATLAHSLKGGSGNIGAMTVHEQAAELEKHCLAGKSDKATASWRTLKNSLAIVLDGLKKLNTPAKPDADAFELSASAQCELKKRLQQFVAALDEDLLLAESVLEKITTLSDRTSHSDQIASIGQAMDSFDIDSARQLAEKVSANLLSGSC